MPVKLSQEEKEERKRCSQINSMLRRAWLKDPERYAVLNANTRPYVGLDKRKKREHQCAVCGGWYLSSQVQIDHIEPVGSFKYLVELGGVATRLFVGREGLQKLCKICHLGKTATDVKNIRGGKC